jgi:site-specific recombinase XerD
MLEQYFKTETALVYSRPGPSQPFLEGFAETLAKEQYAGRTIEECLRAAAHLGAWIEAEHFEILNLNDNQFKIFISHLAKCSCLTGVRCNRTKNTKVRSGARKFFSYLRCIGVVSPAAEKVDLPELLLEFEQWLLSHRGLMASTAVWYRPTILELLKELGDPAGFTLEALRRFVAERSVQFGPKHAKRVLTKLKAFLRFLASHGQCEFSLVDGLPPIAHWRLTSLPAYLAPEDVERIVNATDPSKPIGLRDRAILLFLARLGLRASDIVHMRMEDIDWTSGTFAINGKERRPGRLPLPQEVGNALLAYLSKGRPKVDREHVFLRARPPFGPFRDHSSVSNLVFYAAKRAGVALPVGQMAHALRHSLATGLVRGGVPFQVIRTVLRHRGEDTTAMYAKVDLPSLRKIAQAWPMEVGPC